MDVDGAFSASSGFEQTFDFISNADRRTHYTAGKACIQSAVNMREIGIDERKVQHTLQSSAGMSGSFVSSHDHIYEQIRRHRYIWFFKDCYSQVSVHSFSVHRFFFCSSSSSLFSSLALLLLHTFEPLGLELSWASRSCCEAVRRGE